MSANQAVFPIATMARVLGVSEAGYHAWRHRPRSAHAVADATLLKRVRTIHATSRATYGAPRVHAQLRADGEKHGRKRIARLMRMAGLVGASRRRAGVTTTRRDKEARPAPDLVDRNFVAVRPNQLWVADITFVPTASGFLYLAVALDAWSRKIVGWSMANHLRAELVVDALEMAIGQRRPGDVIHHSDQGSQLRWRSVNAARRPVYGLPWVLLATPCQWRLKFCQKWRSKFDHSVAYRSRPQSRSGLISTSTLRGSGGLCGRHHDLRRPAAATWRHIACGGLARMSWLGQEIRVLA